VDFSKTEQNNSLIAPPIQKPYSKTADLIDLVVEEKWENIFNIPLARAVKKSSESQELQWGFIIT